MVKTSLVWAVNLIPCWVRLKQRPTLKLFAAHSWIELKIDRLLGSGTDRERSGRYYPARGQDLSGGSWAPRPRNVWPAWPLFLGGLAWLFLGFLAAFFGFAHVLLLEVTAHAVVVQYRVEPVKVKPHEKDNDSSALWTQYCFGIAALNLPVVAQDGQRSDDGRIVFGSGPKTKESAHSMWPCGHTAISPLSAAARARSSRTRPIPSPDRTRSSIDGVAAFHPLR